MTFWKRQNCKDGEQTDPWLPGAGLGLSKSHQELFGVKEVFVFKKCIYLWLCWVFFAGHRLSLVVASRGYSLAAVRGLRKWCKLLVLKFNWSSA